MPVLTLLSPAKINLFLHIMGKRADGYHNLQTVFRLIDFYDEMQFSVIDTGAKTDQTTSSDTAPLSLNTNSLITQNPKDNLVIKAGQVLYDFAKNANLLTAKQLADLPYIKIDLKKNIPMGAGLGGGSSNCATTLVALNHLWELKLDNKQLQAIGAKLGADVPIFIFGQDAIAEGIGEILSPIELLPQRFLLLKPSTHIDTKLLFSNEQLKRDCPSFSHDFLQQHSHEFSNQLSQNFGNVFESIVIGLSDSVKNALTYLQTLARTTQTTPRMTGSGSCVFLPLTDIIGESTLAEWQKEAPCFAAIVSTLPNGSVSSCVSNNCA